MARHVFVPLLCLVVLTTTVNSANAGQLNTDDLHTSTVYIETGEYFKIGKIEDSEVKSCELTINNGTKVKMYPMSDKDRKTYSRFDLHYDKCLVLIRRVTKNDTGIWKVQSTVKTDTENNINSAIYNVKVKDVYAEKPIMPASKVFAYPNQKVMAQFTEKFENFTECKLLNSEKKEYDLKSGKSADIELIGQCGFKMTAKKEFHGKWTLVAVLENDIAYFSNFYIIIKNEKELEPEPINFFFKRGEKGEIRDIARNAKICNLQNPQGEKLQIYSRSCDHTIDYVTKYHEGEWIAWYGLTGTEYLVKRKIYVHTYEVSPLNSTVIQTANDIHLLCRVKSHIMEYCSFVRPDGKLLHMTFGVGNNKYEYYGNGIKDYERYPMESYTLSDCGITIRNPSRQDYGSWKCLVSTADKTIKGTILKVNSPLKTEMISTSHISANNVHVKIGDSYKLKCTANEVLSYCWFRSPNGSIHAVLPGHANPPALRYSGESLELGDCTATVDVANYTDAGTWTCHAGIANGPEIKTGFKVILQETYLMANKSLIYLTSSQKSAVLKCIPLPNSKKIVESCRWINPKGSGINIGRYGRYYSVAGFNHCELTILAVDFNEDIGEWSCYARFNKGSKFDSGFEEGNAKIIVAYRSLGATGFFSIGLVVGLLSFTSFGLFMLYLYKRRLYGQQQSDKKVILEKPPKYP